MEETMVMTMGYLMGKMTEHLMVTTMEELTDKKMGLAKALQRVMTLETQMASCLEQLMALSLAMKLDLLMVLYLVSMRVVMKEMMSALLKA